MLKKLAKTIIFVFFIFSCFLIFLTVYYSYKIPNIYKVFIEQQPTFNFFGVNFSKIENEIPSTVTSKKFIENEFYKAKLFNIIPIKTVVVKKYNKIYVMPCGAPFGVKFLTQGVIVVDTQWVSTEQGERNPSKEAGIKKGDIIESVNEEKINSNDDLKHIVLNSYGNPIRIKYNRNFRQYETTLSPVLSTKEKKLLTGIWVRDSSAGIGTITFCTEDGVFGGLGHAICDPDTGKNLPLGSGEIVKAFIKGVKKGICGNPGELCGIFLKDEIIGNVKINADCGLYGKLNKPTFFSKPMMIGFKQEATVGDAYVITTVNGEKPEKYSILIESIDYNSSNKNFFIKIVDERLLDKTGGIVQGMSGSPIIQNEKLIGAISHVLFKDSTRGYGIFAETMLEACDEINLNEKF